MKGESFSQDLHSTKMVASEVSLEDLQDSSIQEAVTVKEDTHHLETIVSEMIEETTASEMTDAQTSADRVVSEVKTSRET